MEHSCFNYNKYFLNLSSSPILYIAKLFMKKPFCDAEGTGSNDNLKMAFVAASLSVL